MADNETKVEEISEAAESSNPDPSPESVLKNLVDNRSDLENEIMKLLSSSKKEYKQLINHWIVSRLRNDNSEAYVCTTEWEAISAEGEKETRTNSFIEIVDEKILTAELEFRPKFNIAKASEMYKLVQSYLPVIYVGSEEKLMKIIRLICSVAEDSMAAEDIPPLISEDEISSGWRSTNVVMRK